MEKDQCITLIELYKSHRELWDTQNTNYFNKTYREDSWKEISQAMKIPLFELKKKMDILLGSYRREKSREKRNRRSNGDEYKSNWYAYEHFKFMAGNKNPEFYTPLTQEDDPQRSSPPNNSDQTKQEIRQSVEDDPLKFIALSPNTSSQRKRIAKTKIQSIKAIPIAKRSRPRLPERNTDGEFEFFGKHVAAQLHCLTEKDAVIAQREIQAVLTHYRLIKIRQRDHPTRETGQSSSHYVEIPPPSTNSPYSQNTSEEEESE